MMDISNVVAKIEKNYITNLLRKGKRIDGRDLMEYRNITINTNIIPKAEGSAEVNLGKTKIICGIKYDIGTPFEDGPDEGVATCMTEFTPLASPLFESGPPSIDAIEAARVIDRGIRHGNCIDYKKLCIKVGSYVYIVFIDLYVFDHFGNIIDCGAIAAMAALLAAKLPSAKMDEKDEKPIWDGKFRTIPIIEAPLSVTFAKIGDYIVVDPSLPEELICDGRISYAVDESGNISSIQKGGEATWTDEEVVKYSRIAIEKANELREKLNLRQYVPKLD